MGRRGGRGLFSPLKFGLFGEVRGGEGRGGEAKHCCPPKEEEEVCSFSLFLSAAKPSDPGTLGVLLLLLLFWGTTFGTYPCAVFRGVFKSFQFFNII